MSNPVGEVKRLFEEHGVGVLCAPEAGAMATEAVALLRDPERARQMGEHARQVAEEHFTWDKLVARLEHFYYLVRNEAEEPMETGPAPLVH